MLVKTFAAETAVYDQIETAEIQATALKGYLDDDKIGLEMVYCRTSRTESDVWA